jgi:hypothetical protein
VDDLRHRLDFYGDPEPPKHWNVQALEASPSAPARTDNAYADALEAEGWSERAIAALVEHASTPGTP